MKKFEAKREGTGTREWSDFSCNICIGCANNCLYCYAADNAATRFKTKARDKWHIEEFSKRSKSLKSFPANKGVVMFPTTHDITPFNVGEYIRVAKLILEKGNRLLIVSKPRMECIIKVLDKLRQYKDQILFRFTIGTTSVDISQFWEPGAPLPSERIDCLALATSRGFKTSVSMEPMLEGRVGAIYVIKSIHERVTDTIWIGKMNKPRLRVDMSCPMNRFAVAEIETLQSDDEILKLYAQLKTHPKVRWKDSIKLVIEKDTERK